MPIKLKDLWYFIVTLDYLNKMVYTYVVTSFERRNEL